MDYRDVILLTVLFLSGFYLWTLPFQDNPLPFGEGDSAWHFAIGDTIAAHDRTITELPNYIGYWYWRYNTILGTGALQYPPSTHVGYAMVETMGGDRFIPTRILISITSFMGAFAVYFLIRKLYGIIPAFLGGFGMIFSLRESVVAIWGQQPVLYSIVPIPLILYASYKYITSVINKKEEKKYAYLTIFTLGLQYLFHLQGFVISIIILLVYVLLILLSQRKIIFPNPKTIIIGSIFFVLIAAPFSLLYLGGGVGEFQADINKPLSTFDRLLSWSVQPELVAGGFPPFFVSFSGSFSNWLIPFILAGAVFIIMKRNSKSILILAWLIGMYIALHLDVLMPFFGGRVGRNVLAESALIFSLAAIGATFLGSVLSTLSTKHRPYIRLIPAFILILVIWFTMGSSFSDRMEQSYTGIQRLTPVQLEVAEWIDQNTPEDAIVWNVGTYTYAKKRWLLAASRRHVLEFEGKYDYEGTWTEEIAPNYVFIDYSDLLLLRTSAQYAEQANSQIEAFQNFEEQLNGTLVYNENNIRIYFMGDF